MKRPFCLIGFTYLISLIVAIFCSTFTLYALIAAAALLFVISLTFKKIRRTKSIPVVFFTALFTFGTYCLHNDFLVKPLEPLDDNDAFIKGVVCELPYRSYNKYYYTIKTEKIEIAGLEDIPQSVKVRLSTNKALDLDVYDKISGKVHLYLPENDLGFSSRNYYAAKGIHVFAYLFDFEEYTEEAGNSKPFYYYCLKAKEALCSSLRSLLLKDHYGIANAMLLGERHWLDDEAKSNFRDIGCSHVLAVSGLHTAVIAEFFTLLFLHLKFSRKRAELLSCLGVLLFMCITCFPASVVRASIMIILFKVGRFFALQSDSLNSLGFATLAIALFNPAAGGDIGFLLSVSATLGIIILRPKLTARIFCTAEKYIATKKKWLKKVVYSLASAIAVTLSATIFTLPISMLYFQKISLVSILSNVLITPLATYLVVLLLFISALNLIPLFKFIVMPFVIICEWLISYMLWLARWLAKCPFASVSTAQPFLLIWMAGTIILLVAALILSKRLKLVKIVAILSSIILFTGVLSFQICNQDTTKLVMADTGDGCSLILTRNNQAAILSCGGDEIKYNKLIGALDLLNVNKITFILLTDFSDATALYAQRLLDEYPIDYVILPDRDDIDDKLSRRIADNNKAKYYNERSSMELWDNVKITAINTDEQGFLYLTVNDVNILVCPSRVNAAYLPEQYRSCHFLIEGKIPENLNSIDAKYAIMANSSNVVNVNIKKIAQSEKIPLATAGMGALCIDFLDQNKVSVRRM